MKKIVLVDQTSANFNVIILVLAVIIISIIIYKLLFTNKSLRNG